VSPRLIEIEYLARSAGRLPAAFETEIRKALEPFASQDVLDEQINARRDGC
jgi:hypothetical protein